MNNYLITLWDDVIGGGSEMEWHRLSDKVFDYVSFNGGFGEGEFEFLMSKLVGEDDGAYMHEAIPALRSLAAICEDRIVSVDKIEDRLNQALFSKSVRIRHAAVEAIWQIADVRFLPLLKEALREERNNDIKNTLDHVIRILGDQQKRQREG